MRQKVQPVVDKYTQELGPELIKQLNEEIQKARTESCARGIVPGAAPRSKQRSTRDSHVPDTRRLRSQKWFDDPSHADMTAIYVERYLNYGLTREELQSGRPIIGIAQTGSDLAPCNRHHLALAERVKAGIRDAGGIPMEFPVHPLAEQGRRPTAALDRNLAYLGLVEILHGYPLDGVVLTTGCDKTTPPA